METKNKLALKTLNIHGFKTFTETEHVDFAEGLNVLLSTTKYPTPSGLWDFCDALRWLFGIRMDHGNIIIFDDSVDFAEVGATVIDAAGNEKVITRRLSKDGNEELISEFEQNAVTLLKGFFVEEDSNTLSFGNTKIVTTSDKELAKEFAMRADKMIGISTDETGKKSKVLVLSKEGV